MTREATMTAPLQGFRVIDMPSVISGPLRTMLLADQGADVIKVEAPGGDHTRTAANCRGGFSASFLDNCSKRSVVLDLKRPDGVPALLRLTAGADVSIQNFRPGVAGRIGIGAAAIRAVSPAVFYV